jgi:hypothetical protein
VGEDELEHTEIESVLEARRELGPTYDAALVQSFADRIERTVQHRVGADMADRHYARRVEEANGKRQVALGIVSSVMGVPISAIALAVPEGDTASIGALCVSWGGLVGINLAHAWQARRRRGPR